MKNLNIQFCRRRNKNRCFKIEFCFFVANTKDDNKNAALYVCISSRYVCMYAAAVLGKKHDAQVCENMPHEAAENFPLA